MIDLTLKHCAAKEMVIVPLSFRAACAFVAAHHRHNKPPRGCKFCIGLQTDDKLIGVACVGRPVARHFDTGLCAEVNRTCVLEGFPNSNSMLYGACWRTAKAMGYRRIITYTQGTESGASMRACGWRRVKELPARSSWAEATQGDLKFMRDPVGNGGIERVLWEATC